MAVIEQTRFEALEPGVYKGRVESVELQDGTFGKQVKLVFGLLDEELVGKALLAWCSAKLSPKSKLWGWTSALLFNGKGIPEGYDLDTDTLIGREGLLTVELQEKDGTQFNKVTSILPIRRPGNGTVKARPAPAPEPQEPPEYLMENEDIPF